MKRKWTRGEKLLWLAPLIFVVAAGVAAYGPDVVRRQTGRPQRLTTTADNRLLTMALSRDGSTLAATGVQSSMSAPLGRVFFWDTRAFSPLPTWGKPQPQKPVITAPSQIDYGLTLSPDGKDVALLPDIYASGRNSYALFGRASQIEKWRIGGQFDDLSAHFSPDGQTLALARRAKTGIEFLLLRVSDGAIINRWVMERPRGYIGVFAWAPDGKTLACASSTGMRYVARGDYEPPALIQIRRAHDGKLLHSWTLPIPSIANLDIAPAGRSIALIVTGTERSNVINTSTLMVADTATGHVKWQYLHKESESTRQFPVYPHLYGGVFSPDGTTVAVFPQGFEKGGTMAGPLLFDVQTGVLKRTLNIGSREHSFQYAPDALAWAPDGKRLYARGMDAVLVWDLD